MKSGFNYLSDRALYKEYRRRTDPREVLAYYGADNVTEKQGTHGTELIHSCLLDRVEPHHRHGDSSPSASMNVDHKLYHCHSYWGGDIFHFIMKMEKMDNFSQLVRFLIPFLSNEENPSEVFKKEIERLFSDTTGVYSLDLPRYSDKILKPWLVSHPYLRENRGVSVEASSKLKIGYDPGENRLVFPHYWQGQLVGYQKRAIPAGRCWPASPSQYPKYKNSLSFPKSVTLYNYDRLEGEETVIVVESAMSVAKAHSLGIENVVSTFGASITDGQTALLRSFKNVVVWMDKDDGGYKGEKKLVNDLHKFTRVVVVEPEEDKDLGDYNSREEVEEKIESAVPAMLKLIKYRQEEDVRRRVRTR